MSSSLPQTVRIRGGGESLRSGPGRSEFLKIMMRGVEGGLPENVDARRELYDRLVGPETSADVYQRAKPFFNCWYMIAGPVVFGRGCAVHRNARG